MGALGAIREASWVLLEQSGTRLGRSGQHSADMLNFTVFSMFFVDFPGAEGLSCVHEAHMAVLWAQVEAHKAYVGAHEAHVEAHKAHVEAHKGYVEAHTYVEVHRTLANYRNTRKLSQIKSQSLSIYHLICYPSPY